LVAAGLGAIMTFVLLKIIDAVIGLRVDPEAESLGLDLAEHGEKAYND
jgi:Amt family ammonium transporter